MRPSIDWRSIGRKREVHMHVYVVISLLLSYLSLLHTIVPSPYLDGAGIGIEAGRLHAALEILNVVSNVDELRLHECQLIL